MDLIISRGGLLVPNHALDDRERAHADVARSGPNDSQGVKGVVKIELFGPNGKLKDFLETRNLAVTSGKCGFASRLKGTATVAPSHMSVGTNNTAPAASNAALGAEVASSKTALTSTILRANLAEFACTFGAGVGTGALVEAGIFNGTTAVATGLSYTRTGNQVNVSKTSHGLAVDRAIGIAAATDTGLNGGSVINLVPGANNFEFYTTSAGANGTLSLYQDIMYLRTTFSVINKGAGDSMTITWTLTFS